MIFTTKSYKMLSPLPSSSPQCKSSIRMTLALWLMVVLTLIVYGQAGVIKKREIPFTIETKAATTTATEATTALPSVLTITVKHDPDIAQSDLSQTSITPLTMTTPITTTDRVVVETTTTEPVTKLEMKPSNNVGSSREYVLNEIALNETKKDAKSLDHQGSVDIQKETDVDLKKAEGVANATLNIGHVGAKNSIENEEILKKSSNSQLKLGNVNGHHINTVVNNGELLTNVNKGEENHNKPLSTTLEHNVTNEMVANIDHQTQTTTFSTLRDNTIETNHILQPTKHPEVTTTPIAQDLQPLVSTENVQTLESATVMPLSQDLSAKEKSKGISESTTSSSLRIHDGLDRESFREISNDLPEKTTESTFRTETVFDSNKVEHARSMSMAGEVDIATTLLPEGGREIETSTSLPNSHLDHLKNSIDVEEFTPSPPNEKKAKFINDNSTNAQKLNLPNNADVWSLVGMKPLTSSPNVTIETAQKHKDLTATPQEKLDEKDTLNKTTTQSSINNNNSEKFLLDWSQIMMNKELATTANYQENGNGNYNFHSSTVGAAALDESVSAAYTTVSPVSSDVSEGKTNVPNNTAVDEPATITANSTTILSVSSFDNNNENNHNKHEVTPASIVNSVTEMLDVTTEIMPTATVVSQLETKANPDLNEINLTFNKTATIDVGETTQHRDEQQHAANNRDGEGDVNVNVNVHNGVTSEPQLTATTVVDDMTNGNNISTTTTTTTESTTAAAMTTTMTATSTADTTSSEPTITFSTQETGKVNASNSSERNTIFDDSEKRLGIKTVNNNKLGDKENIEIFATTTAATTTTTGIPITTYKPKFVDFDFKPSGEQKNTTTTSSSSNKIPIAEVVDQNGNEIEHKKSINVETTTATQPISGSLNISSTTIKTHLNEQVFEIAATTTTTPDPTTTTITPYNIPTTESSETSEKTTSSSAKDEIINGKDFQLKENNIITTPKPPTTTTTAATTSLYSPSSTEQVERTAIGSSPAPPLEQNKKEEVEGELEATTTRTDTSETPVVAQQTTAQGVSTESFGQTTTLPTTTTTASSNEEDRDTTTKVDTYFEFPTHNKGSKKEEQPEATVEPIKDDKLETTTTMSLQPASSNTTEKEDTNNTFLNETDIINTNTTTTTQTSVAGPEENIYTTSTSTAQTTTSTISPPTPTIATTDSFDVSTKIDEINKIVISTSSESPHYTTQSSVKVSEIDSESPPIYTTTPTTTTTTLSNNINEDLYTTLSSNSFNEELTTMIPPKIITADIGGGQQGGGSNSMPPLMGGNSGNMFPKNSEASGETDVNVIIAITVSVIGVIALILLVAFLYLMRKRQKQTSYSQRCRPVSLDEYAIDSTSVGGSMRKGSALRSSKRTYNNLAFDDPSLRHNPLGVHELAKFSMEKLRIFEEFRDVPQITAREDEVPQGCEDKNRYANVLPLPESRVVLQQLDDDYKTEYINANYVTGPKDTPNYYIACQAPLESTVEDFWRMIWEQQSRVIIQATDLIENGVEKCAEYLPPSVTLDNHSTFGDFQITLQNREVKDKYAISTILLKHNGENVTRELTHYWYKWPETGVPAEEAPIIAMLLEARSSLISYAIEQANEDKEKNSNATLKSAEEGTVSVGVNGSSSSPKEGNVSANGGGNGEINGNISMVPLKKTARNQGPLTIHCSPGTGRTGTIIGCDIAIRSLETPKRTVDIPHIVYYVRRGRASAVLTKEQYEFIYKVANVYAAKISNPTTYN